MLTSGMISDVHVGFQGRTKYIHYVAADGTLYNRDTRRLVTGTIKPDGYIRMKIKVVALKNTVRMVNSQ